MRKKLKLLGLMLMLSGSLITAKAVSPNTLNLVSDSIYQNFKFNTPLNLTKEDIKTYEMLSPSFKTTPEQDLNIMNGRKVTLDKTQVKKLIFGLVHNLKTNANETLLKYKDGVATVDKDGDINRFIEIKGNEKIISTDSKEKEEKEIEKLLSPLALIPKNYVKSDNKEENKLMYSDLKNTLTALKDYKNMSPKINYLYSRLEQNKNILEKEYAKTSVKNNKIYKIKFVKISDNKTIKKDEVKKEYNEFLKEKAQKSLRDEMKKSNKKTSFFKKYKTVIIIVAVIAAISSIIFGITWYIKRA